MFQIQIPRVEQWFPGMGRERKKGSGKWAHCEWVSVVQGKY